MEHYLRHLKAAGQAETTVELRRYQLLRLKCSTGTILSKITADQLEDYLASVAGSREYKRSLRSAFRGYYTFLHARGERADNPAAALPAIKPAPPRPRPAADVDYQRALRDARPRERLMVRLAAEAGLRRGEVAVAHCDDVIRDLIGLSLVVHGKGGKQRIVPLKDSLASELEAWIRVQGEGWLFPGHTHGHLSPWYVGRLVSDLLPAGVTMHALRHRFATRVHASTGDLLVTQQLLGHASPETTQIYVLVDQARLRSAVQAA